MMEALRSRRTYRGPQNTIIRRPVSRPIADANDPPEEQITPGEIKLWLSLQSNLFEVGHKESGKTPIFYATLSDSSSEISQILSKTPDINIKDKSNHTPLHWAVINNNLKAVRLFMTRKPDLNIRNDVGNTALHLASETKNINLEIIQAIVVEKRCLHAKNSSGLTPLHVATINNNIKLMATLLDLGSKPNMIDNENGWTPLHHAAMGCYSKAALLLLKHGANPNIKDRYGQSPLFNAVTGGNLRMVIDMVTHRANIYISDDFGQTPIHLAARNTTPSILSWFLTNWCININCQNYRGETLLHCAIDDNRHENVKAILLREPDLNIQNNKGFTVVDLCRNKELIKHIIKLKAAKVPISKRILDIVYTKTDAEFIGRYEKRCYDELEQMKGILFPGLRMSYCKFSFASLQKRAEYMMNKKVLLYNNNTNSSDMSSRFPIYWGIIERRYFDARDRCKLLEKLEYKKNEIFRYIPDHCINNTLSYLNSKDIIKMLKAL